MTLQKVTEKKKKTETTKERIIRVLKKTAGTFSGAGNEGEKRRDQFATYMKMVDSLQRAKMNLSGRIQLGNLEARSGKIGGAKITNMSTIMSKYHDKALRMAQAKYYQKQLG